jgi:excisionase family DNA binding protein
MKAAKKIAKHSSIQSITFDGLRKKLKSHSKPVLLEIDRKKYLITPDELMNRNSESAEVLSTQEVADLLNVSRPFVVGLIDSGEIEASYAGKHRRVSKVVALAYKAKMRERQNKAMNDLVKETEKLGLDF